MSIPVELGELAEQIAKYGRLAYLITVSESGLPHAVSVGVTWDEDTLVAGAGRRTAENVAHRPDVTLLWPAPSQQPYCLITDGRASARLDAETLAIQPVRAVLHRVAEADPEVPSCVTVLDHR